MKKSSLIIICLIVTYMSAFAQTEYGVRAGINYSYMLGGNAFLKDLTYIDGGKKANTQFMLGFHGGFYARLPISEQAYFQPELMISERGAVNKVTDVTRMGNASGSEELTVKYFNEFVFSEANLLVGFRLNDNMRFTVGPQIGYVLDARRRVENEIQDFNQIDIAKVSSYRLFEYAKANAADIGIDPSNLDAEVNGLVGELTGKILYKKRPSLGLATGMTYEFDFGLNIGINAEYMFIAPYKLSVKDPEIKEFLDDNDFYTYKNNKQLFNTINFQLSVGYTLAPHKIYRFSHRRR
jgi:Outer membrane protein beta-barrel domain